jgi:outer membrane protein assembly factor BamB
VAVAAKTSETIWTFAGGEAYVASPVVVDGVIYIASFAIDADRGNGAIHALG